MSSFAAKIHTVKIEPHPQADGLEIARIGDYCSCVQKGKFQTGDLVVYIPEQAVLPTAIIEQLGLTGKLAGTNANRVAAVRLRGILSEGLIYPLTFENHKWFLKVPAKKSPGNTELFPVVEGDDVTALMDITKYEPPIPPELQGRVFHAGIENCLKYDIENIKAYPDVLKDGEPVVVTEKIHGVWMQVGILPDNSSIISSKELAHKGLAFALDGNDGNYYVGAAKHHRIVEKIKRIYPDRTTPYIVVGEVFGRKVQDLSYGANTTKSIIGFRVFDIYLGERHKSRFLDDVELEAECKKLNLERVPVLYRGRFSNSVINQYTSGQETVSGNAAHLREGIVIRPQQEREDMTLGRVILKSVSEAYLTRKGGTEYR